ncbi:ubiquitin fusion degradation protein UFD1-domain-containing protein [Scheffersomyces coipomensis]|uniref:ubiquitin fusion degradation protein UFD1-domain-containing protein n=1 Tax=Scheffersomyces coipomensis TaxID=1788519 RepID=UPI00315D17F5
MFSGFGATVFGGGFSSPMSNKFEDFFRCYPVAMMPDHIRKDDANFGGKIFLPPSALNKLTMLHIRYPMLFELSNEAKEVKTHSGVLEFVAEEGRVYIPQWMMTTLKVSPGQLLKVSNCDLPLGSFVKIEPQSVDFLDISDPKAVLENVLRKFSTLTVNDIIEINYNDSIYGIKVLETKPDSNTKGICVVETDLETDFAPPVGYVEPEYKPVPKKPSTPIDPASVNRGAGAATMAKSINYAQIVAEASKPGSDSFHGSGQKLSGKPTEEIQTNYKIDDLDPEAPPAPLNLPDNQLFFGFPVVLPSAEDVENDTDNNPDDTASNTDAESAFSGAGQSLRQSKKRKDKNSSYPSLKNYSRSPDYIEID